MPGRKIKIAEKKSMPVRGLFDGTDIENEESAADKEAMKDTEEKTISSRINLELPQELNDRYKYSAALNGISRRTELIYFIERCVAESENEDN